MSEIKEENNKEETETKIYKSVETNEVNGRKTIHEEEETKKKTRIEKNNDGI